MIFRYDKERQKKVKARFLFLGVAKWGITVGRWERIGGCVIGGGKIMNFILNLCEDNEVECPAKTKNWWFKREFYNVILEKLVEINGFIAYMISSMSTFLLFFYWALRYRD